ncbi:unnamed protein product [Merluccius merluccius]
MDRRQGPVILIVLLSVITDMPAAGQLEDICASCHLNAVCIDKVEGSGKMCICMHGFSGNGREYCQDKDECLIGIKICGLHTSCHNTFGSYYCTCRPGFSPSNHQTAFIPNDGTYCQDVDECQRIPGVCGAGAGCENLEGDFECRCLLGYRVHNAAEPFHPLRDKGSCKVVDCGPSTPTVAGTVVLSTTGTTYGNKVLLGCQDGFVLRRGDTSSTCGGDGSWSRPGLVCEEVDCGSPPTPPHSHMVRWDKMSRLGSAVLYHCNSGYQNVGRDTVSVCTASGQWEVSMLCEEITCGRPPVVRSTKQVWNGDTAPGSTVLYSCIEGFNNSGGNGLLHCNDTGHWTKPTISCHEISCGNPHVLPHTGQLWNGSSSPGTVVFYYCKMGFHEDKIDFNYSRDAANMSVCTKHGYWKRPNILCKALNCGGPPDPPHAFVLWGNGSTLGSWVVYQCKPGYHNMGEGNGSVCSASGEWSPARFLCQEIQCGKPLFKPHAKVLWDNATHVGSVVHYQCDEGYHATSATTNSSVCGKNGQWKESDLQCEEIQCGKPLFKPHAKVLWDNATHVGSVVHYQCDEGYHATSATTNSSVCGENGQWKESDLQCEAGCGSAPWLAQAVVVWYNTSVTVHRCMDGYHSWRGSDVSVCGSTGKWQKATLKCVEVKPAINDLHVFNEKCLRWRAEKYEHDLEYYKVVYRGTREYQGYFHHERKQLLISGAEWVDLCLGLLPATNYTVSITALSTRFTASITTNTSLQVPQAPSILYTELDTLTPTLRLQRSAHTLDAISVYQVFVVPLDRTVVFDCKSRGSPDFSVVGPLSGPYITGQFPVRHMSSTQMNFTLGDGCYYGGFFNAPLKRGRNYYVILRVVSHWKEAFKSSCVLWAKVSGTSNIMKMCSLWAAGSVGVLVLVVLLGYSCGW